MTITREELIADAKLVIYQFIGSGDNRAWLYPKVGEFYFRQGAHHSIDGRVRTCFDVSNVSIDEKYRGFAIMHELLEWLNTMHTDEVTYIESIQNEGFAKSLIEHNWLPTGSKYDVNLYRERSYFDPTAYTFVVQPRSPSDCAVDGPFTWEGRIEEFPGYTIYEVSERHVRRELFRFLDEMHPMVPCA